MVRSAYWNFLSVIISMFIYVLYRCLCYLGDSVILLYSGPLEGGFVCFIDVIIVLVCVFGVFDPCELILYLFYAFWRKISTSFFSAANLTFLSFAVGLLSYSV